MEIIVHLPLGPSRLKFYETEQKLEILDTYMEW